MNFFVFIDKMASFDDFIWNRFCAVINTKWNKNNDELSGNSILIGFGDKMLEEKFCRENNDNGKRVKFFRTDGCVIMASRREKDKLDYYFGHKLGRERGVDKNVPVRNYVKDSIEFDKWLMTVMKSIREEFSGRDVYNKWKNTYRFRKNPLKQLPGSVLTKIYHAGAFRMNELCMHLYRVLPLPVDEITHRGKIRMQKWLEERPHPDDKEKMKSVEYVVAGSAPLLALTNADDPNDIDLYVNDVMWCKIKFNEDVSNIETFKVVGGWGPVQFIYVKDIREHVKTYDIDGCMITFDGENFEFPDGVDVRQIIGRKLNLRDGKFDLISYFGESGATDIELSEFKPKIFNLETKYIGQLIGLCEFDKLKKYIERLDVRKDLGRPLHRYSRILKYEGRGFRFVNRRDQMFLETNTEAMYLWHGNDFGTMTYIYGHNVPVWLLYKEDELWDNEICALTVPAKNECFRMIEVKVVST